MRKLGRLHKLSGALVDAVPMWSQRRVEHFANRNRDGAITYAWIKPRPVPWNRNLFERAPHGPSRRLEELCFSLFFSLHSLTLPNTRPGSRYPGQPPHKNWPSPCRAQKLDLGEGSAPHRSDRGWPCHSPLDSATRSTRFGLIGHTTCSSCGTPHCSTNTYTDRRPL